MFDHLSWTVSFSSNYLSGALKIPEIAVVNQDQIGLGFDGCVQQGLACGYAADDAHHLRAALHLQAIGAVIGNFSVGLFVLTILPNSFRS